jgi:hypothetical protein
MSLLDWGTGYAKGVTRTVVGLEGKSINNTSFWGFEMWEMRPMNICVATINGSVQLRGSLGK